MCTLSGVAPLKCSFGVWPVSQFEMLIYYVRAGHELVWFQTCSDVGLIGRLDWIVIILRFFFFFERKAACCRYPEIFICCWCMSVMVSFKSMSQLVWSDCHQYQDSMYSIDAWVDICWIVKLIPVGSFSAYRRSPVFGPRVFSICSVIAMHLLHMSRTLVARSLALVFFTGIVVWSTRESL